MSQEHVEVMGTAMEAFNRRDGNRFDSLLTEDAEIVPVRAALEVGLQELSSMGREGLEPSTLRLRVSCSAS
jgi:hypothetical protein